jgi:beta-1,4-mannosyl-glycoprotein beta-1,4-N-acetylglucosaminyltransferase
MIYDCITFFNEYELLNLRLHELADYVDRFVIAESTHTFQGRAKPMLSPDVYEGFPVIHVVVEPAMAVPEASWENEYWLRDEGWRRALKDADATDYVFLSDADEIPRPATAMMFPDHPVRFAQSFYYYWLNYRTDEPWYGTVRSTVERTLKGPQAEFMLRGADIPAVPDGGWHFSFLGGPEKVRDKLQAFAHIEYAEPPYTNLERIADRLASGADLFDRPQRQYPVPIDDSYPLYLREHLEEFQHLIHA